MTDMEMTRLCATAMGYAKYQWQTSGIISGSNIPIGLPDGIIQFDPLHEDAQAMAIVKKFNLWIRCDRGRWSVCNADNELEIYDHKGSWFRNDLNRAIVEWAAAWQASKTSKTSK